MHRCLELSQQGTTEALLYSQVNQLGLRCVERVHVGIGDAPLVGALTNLQADLSAASVHRPL